MSQKSFYKRAVARSESEAAAARATVILSAAELRQLEATNLRAALAVSDGKIYGANGAAARLGMKPTTLASRMKALGIASNR